MKADMITNDMPESNVILVEFDPTNKIWPENEFEYLGLHEEPSKKLKILV